MCVLRVEGGLADRICGPEISDLESLKVCGNQQAAHPGLCRMCVHPPYQIHFSLTRFAFDLAVFGRVPGSGDQCLPITFRSELRSQEGDFLWIMMPFRGIIRTLDLDVKSSMRDNLLLLMPPPRGDRPSAFPDSGQQGRGVECVAHPGSPSGKRTVEKESF